MAKKTLFTHNMKETLDNFGDLYETHLPSIRRFMFWRTRDEMLADDLTSSVFEKAWRTRENFTGGSSGAWLHKIARTTLIDYWRKHKEIIDETMVANAPSNAESLEVEIDQKMRVEQLQKAILQLPNEMRQVVELRFMSGLSAHETGERLGLSEANVRVIQYRALRKLRSSLQ
jgi:RNA polymerase sigma-70 factor (ECF subfamily)